MQQLLLFISAGEHQQALALLHMLPRTAHQAQQMHAICLATQMQHSLHC
jgi:hypothetical protein